MLKVAGGVSGGGSNGTVTLINTGTGLTGGPITASGTIALANTAVTAGTYGTATQVSQVVIDAQGRITSASNVAIAISNSAVSGLGTMSTQDANNVTITGGTVGNSTLTNVNITSVAATFPNNYLANSSTTLGNAVLTLGSTTSSVGNLTLSNVTISSGSVTANVTSNNVNLTGTTSSTATFATSSLPLVPEGYITVQIGGVNKKIPYYGV
jgi:hypothetical protein